MNLNIAKQNNPNRAHCVGKHYCLLFDSQEEIVQYTKTYSQTQRSSALSFMNIRQLEKFIKTAHNVRSDFLDRNRNSNKVDHELH